MEKVFMEEALKQAKKALEILEVPVGCVIVKDGEIIATGFNKKELNQDPTEHAEIIAIKQASKKLKNWRLSDCDMYVTLEPCAMCAGAIMQSRLKNVYIACMHENFGYCGSVINLLDYNKYDYKVNVETGLCQEEAKQMLLDFFDRLRELKSK